jgi:hypothetical protein
MRGGDWRFRSKKGVNAVAKQLISISDGHQSLTGFSIIELIDTNLSFAIGRTDSSVYRPVVSVWYGMKRGIF